MERQTFEQNGWKFKHEFEGILDFEKGDIWKPDGLGAFLEVNTNDHTIKITTTDKGFDRDGPNCSVKYNGTCKNIEEFDMICKLIQLKI